MAYTPPKDVTLTANAYSASQAQKAAETAQNSANNANTSYTKLNAADTWTPITKRLLQLRLQQYQAQYSEMLSDPLIDQVDAATKAAAQSNLADLQNRTAQILADMASDTQVSQTDAYYIKSDENYVSTYLTALGNALGAAHKKHLDQVNADIQAASDHADNLADEAKQARAGIQSSVDALSSKIGDLNGSSDVISYVKQTASELSAQVTANSYQNIVDITTDGIYLKAKGDSKDKKIILDGDSVDIKSSLGTTIAGALEAQVITASVIRTSDWRSYLDMTRSKFKMGDTFFIDSDGSVSIKGGSLSVDTGNFAFYVGDNTSVNKTKGLYLRNGADGDSNKVETWLNSDGLHQYKGGQYWHGTFLNDGALTIKPDNISKNSYQRFPTTLNAGEDNYKDINSDLVNYYNAQMNIGSTNYGSNITMTAARADGSHAGWSSIVSADGIFCGYYPYSSNTTTKINYAKNNLANGVTDTPRSMSFVSNQGLQVKYYQLFTDDSGNRASDFGQYYGTTIGWNSIELKADSGKFTGNNGTTTITPYYMNVGVINTGQVNSGNIQINSAHTIASTDGGKLYFAKGWNNDARVPIKARQVEAENLYLSDGHDICSADGGKIYFTKARGSSQIAVGALSFDKSSPLSTKNVSGLIDGSDAVSAITGTDWAAFTYKNDDTNSPQYGAIIDDVNASKVYHVDSRFISPDGAAISQDNIIGFLGAAVKELANQINQLQQQQTQSN